LIAFDEAHDYDGDGIADFAFAEMWAYDVHGNLLSNSVEYDYDGDGVADYYQSVTYVY
jgi:nitrous oxidase accessory protein NosD